MSVNEFKGYVAFILFNSAESVQTPFHPKSVSRCFTHEDRFFLLGNISHRRNKGLVFYGHSRHGFCL